MGPNKQQLATFQIPKFWTTLLKWIMCLFPENILCGQASWVSALLDFWHFLKQWMRIMLINDAPHRLGRPLTQLPLSCAVLCCAQTQGPVSLHSPWALFPVGTVCHDKSTKPQISFSVWCIVMLEVILLSTHAFLKRMGGCLSDRIEITSWLILNPMAKCLDSAQNDWLVWKIQI